jgi:hypothetical protein
MGEVATRPTHALDQVLTSGDSRSEPGGVTGGGGGPGKQSRGHTAADPGRCGDGGAFQGGEGARMPVLAQLIAVHRGGVAQGGRVIELLCGGDASPI